MAVSLSDIAERAGVSVKTVSGALHGGSARMSDDTRQKIKAIAEELGYVTNLAARGVRQGWLPLVGVVSDGLITSPFATEIVRGLDGAARSAEAWRSLRSTTEAASLSARCSTRCSSSGHAPLLMPPCTTSMWPCRTG